MIIGKFEPKRVFKSLYDKVQVQILTVPEPPPR